VLRSLQVKFSALIVTLLVVACVSLAWLSTRHEERALATEVEHRAQALARGLAGNVKEPLVVRDDLTLASRVQQLGIEPGVAAARVLDAEGRVVAALAEAELGQRRPLASGTGGGGSHARRSGTRLLVAAPIQYSGVPVGEAQVELDLGVLVAPKVQEGARQLAVVAVAVAALGVLGGVGFVSLLVGPIRRLRAGVERLSNGDLAVRVPPTSRDEIGDLTVAFNTMGESLQQKERIQSAFGRYVSDYVLAQLLEGPEGTDLAGVEREVTLLFADIRRFTRLSEGMKARDVVRLLNEFFDLVAARILAQGGTIDKFIGDSVMAYFGAPIAQPDHALRAVWAAVEVERDLVRRNRALGPGATPIGVGIGIHTGVVVVGSIGSERRSDFTAIGDAVNVASRLEKLARPGEILLSEAVQRRVRGALPLRFEGERQLSGRIEPVHVYSVDLLGVPGEAPRPGDALAGPA
jgi:class 3 adenylate cyclase/uncharacterized membrane protein affecting hemolysin expression